MSIIDERTARTRAKIASAIIGLGKRQPVDSITVGQLASAAGISRSTFYANFGSLRDYLTRSYATMLELGALRSAAAPGAGCQPLAVRAILDHVSGAGAYAKAVMASSHYPAMVAAGEERLRLVTLANLRRLGHGLDEADREATANFIAGGFMGMLGHWKASGMREAPDRLQQRFESRCRALLTVSPGA